MVKSTNQDMRKKSPLLLIFCLWMLCIPIASQGQNQSEKSEKQPVRITGTFISQVEGYYAKGIETARKPFSFTTSGNFNLAVYGFKIPISFLLSNQNFTYAQPFSRLGISPEYKWVRFHFGYRNISYSQYTLAGHSFLGAGIDLNPGKFRFSALYGRFRKKTIPSTVNPLDTLIAPMRYGYAGKIGFGDKQNFVDLVFLKIRDDTLGVNDGDPELYKTPQSNLVTGLNMRITFHKSLVFEAETAVSLLTRNLNALGFEELGLTQFADVARVLSVNISSTYAIALRGALNYTTPNFSAGIQYRRVDPGFTSFGAHFFNTDLEHLTLNTQFRLLDKKMNIRANFGLKNDNLKNNKVSSSAKIIAMLAMQYNSGKAFSIDGSFSNYSISQKAGRLPLEDTIRLFQSNMSITIMPRMMFTGNENFSHAVQWAYTRSDLIDHNPYTEALTEVTSDVAMMNYLISFVPIALNLNSGISYIGMHNALASRNNYVLMLGLNKALFKNKLSVGITGSGGISIVNDVRGTVYNTTCSAMLKAFKKHGFKFFLHFQTNKYPDNSPQKSYQEFKINVSYVYSI